MEGSIADSTSLRIRDRLQAGFHAATNRPQQGLFEELLKVPLSPSPRPESNSEEPNHGEDLPETAAQVTDKPASADNQSDKEEVQDEDRAADEARLHEAALATMVQVVPVADAPLEPTLKTPSSQIADDAELATTTSVEQQMLAQDVAIPAAQISAADQTLSADDAANVQPDAVPVEATSESEQVASSIAIPTAAPAVPRAERKAAKVDVRVDQSAKPIEQSSAETSNIAPSENVEHGRPAARETDQQSTQQSEFAVQTQDTRAEHTEREHNEDRREKWYVTDKADAANETFDAQHGKSESDEHDKSDAAALSDATAKMSDLAQTEQLESELAMAAATATSAAPASDVAAQALAASGTGRSAIESVSDSARSRTGSTTSTSSIDGPSSASSAVRSESSKLDTATAKRANSDARELTQQERVRLVQRVARSFSRLGPDGGQITLRLHPPQLGVLNVSVRIEGQTMSAKLQTESSAARDVILENLPVLRERLAEQGIDVAQFQVDVANPGDLGGGQQPGNSFAGDPNSSRDNNRFAVDYRRLSRDSEAAGRAKENVSRLTPASWSTRSAGDRTLDIRA